MPAAGSLQLDDLGQLPGALWSARARHGARPVDEHLSANQASATVLFSKLPALQQALRWQQHTSASIRYDKAHTGRLASSLRVLPVGLQAKCKHKLDAGSCYTAY